jgi:hypothetical protein
MEKTINHLRLKSTTAMPAFVARMAWSKSIEGTRRIGIPDATKGKAATMLVRLDDLEDGWYVVAESGDHDRYFELSKGKATTSYMLEAEYQAVRVERQFGEFFPKLKGSVKQLGWATQIRAATILGLMEAHPHAKFPLAATQHIFLSESAHWWIENVDNVLADTLLSIERWKEPEMRRLISSLPTLDAPTIPMATWASRLRLNCVLSLNFDAANRDLAIEATRLFLITTNKAKWWIDQQNLKEAVHKGRKAFGRSIVRTIPEWYQGDEGEYYLPPDLELDIDLAFLKDPAGEWHIYTKELGF